MYIVHVKSTKPTPLLEAHTVRLDPELWAVVVRDARRLRLAPSDYLRRRIEDAFSFTPEVYKMNRLDPDEIIEVLP